MQKESYIKRYGIIPLIITLTLINGAIIYLLPRYRFDSIVLHHSASWHDNYESIRAYHRTKWWVQDAAYHLILSNGNTDVPLGHLEATGRYKNLSYSIATMNPRYNLRAIHVCVIGNYHERPVSRSMRPVIGHALKSLMDKYNIPRDRIVFHRDIGATVCPGKYITKDILQNWIEFEADKCPSDIKAQQQAVINHAGYSIWTFPRPVLAFMLILSLLFAAVWMISVRIFSKPKKTPEIYLESYEETI